jgi:hypothetical protein
VRMKVATLPTPLDLVTFTVALPARFDAELAPFNIIPVQPSLPRGSYELSCALEEPASSAIQYENRAPFGLH